MGESEDMQRGFRPFCMLLGSDGSGEECTYFN